MVRRKNIAALPLEFLAHASSSARNATVNANQKL